LGKLVSTFSNKQTDGSSFHSHTRSIAERYVDVVENALDTLNCYDWQLFCAH